MNGNYNEIAFKGIIKRWQY